MKYCKFCGNKIDDDSAFCSDCGHSIPDAPIPTKKPTESTPVLNVVITPGSCPNCSSTGYQTTKTKESQIKRHRVCNNCGNFYRTVEDIEKDIQYCESALRIILSCAVILFIIVLVAFIQLDAYKTLLNWDSAGDDKKSYAIFTLVISIAGFSAVFPSLKKRAKELDELSCEKDYLKAKNRTLYIKNVSALHGYKSTNQNIDTDIEEENAMAYVAYTSDIPSSSDFDLLMKRSRLKDYLIEKSGDNEAYEALYKIIHDKFKEMTKDSKPDNSRRFICKKDAVEVEVILTYGEGTLSCEMNFKC